MELEGSALSRDVEGGGEEGAPFVGWLDVETVRLVFTVRLPSSDVEVVVVVVNTRSPLTSVVVCEEELEASDGGTWDGKTLVAVPTLVVGVYARGRTSPASVL